MTNAGEAAGITGREASSQQWNAFLREGDDQVFLLLTLLIGALVGMVVVAFILLTERFGARLYPAGGSPWRRLLVPVAGSAIMGYLLYRFFPDARGSGVPQTKAALYARGGRISLGTVIGKFFCTSTTLASGIPLGREGPAVQVGAGIASVLGRKLGLRPEKVKALIPVGAAAAIAAAFNTPLAAVLFALEEVVGDLHAAVLGSVVLASATSWAMLRLLLGAMLGGIVGNVANHLLPSYVGTPGAYALVGMGTAFAGIVRAPMTSVVMIFEITRDYAVIVPLMISNLVSFYISSKFQEQPIYEELSHQDGIHLPRAEARQLEGQRQVAQAMRNATERLSAEMTVQGALEKFSSSEFQSWPVCDERGVIGVVRLQDLKSGNNDGLGTKRLSEILDAGEFPHVHADHSLHVALDRMGASQLDVLPVVSRVNVHHLEGVVTLQDLLAHYGVGPKESR